jgi:DNA-binding PadR family transcriptional regulator
MSIRHSLLTLLERRPMYGYELRSEFEARTGATWPLNVGQVYSTLGRLERDGLVEPAGDDGKGHAYYRITAGGRKVVHDWFATPVSRSNPPRDELAIKLAMAVSVRGLDVRDVVQRQRTATMRALQEYTLLKPRAAEAAADEPGDLAWLLVLDALVFQAEAEIRWLDHCESRLARAAGSATAAGEQLRAAEPGVPAEAPR